MTSPSELKLTTFSPEQIALFPENDRECFICKDTLTDSETRVLGHIFSKSTDDKGKTTSISAHALHDTCMKHWAHSNLNSIRDIRDIEVMTPEARISRIKAINVRASSCQVCKKPYNLRQVAKALDISIEQDITENVVQRSSEPTTRFDKLNEFASKHFPTMLALHTFVINFMIAREVLRTPVANVFELNNTPISVDILNIELNLISLAIKIILRNINFETFKKINNILFIPTLFYSAKINWYISLPLTTSLIANRILSTPQLALATLSGMALAYIKR